MRIEFLSKFVFHVLANCLHGVSFLFFFFLLFFFFFYVSHRLIHCLLQKHSLVQLFVMFHLLLNIHRTTIKRQIKHHQSGYLTWYDLGKTSSKKTIIYNSISAEQVTSEVYMLVYVLHYSEIDFCLC